MINVRHGKVLICHEDSWTFYDYLDLTIAMFEFFKKYRPTEEDAEELMRDLFERGMRGEAPLGEQPEVWLYEEEEYNRELVFDHVIGNLQGGEKND